jgi:hypothetical protein
LIGRTIILFKNKVPAKPQPHAIGNVKANTSRVNPNFPQINPVYTMGHTISISIMKSFVMIFHLNFKYEAIGSTVAITTIMLVIMI